MHRRVLVLVPHQDDELNIAGQILPTLLDAGYECKICFSTNGDGFKSNGTVRLKEAMEVADNLGVGRDNLVFLGFEDSMGPDHPYGCTSKLAVANAPLAKVYSESLAPYSELRCGAALPQCRETLVSDIAHLISSWRPDIVICVDYDSHPDHRALSLAFEEALGRCMRNDGAYRPLVLKKFAYPSVWYGPEDYWSFAPTVKPDRFGEFELENPMYTWDERVRAAPHPSAITQEFFSNVVVKAAMRYPSQNGWFRMTRVCNADAVYWVRRTDDLVFGANVVASSGDAWPVSDFMLFDSTDVCSSDAAALAGRGLRFESADEERSIRVSFNAPQRVIEVVVREAVGSFESFDGATIAFDGEEPAPLLRSEAHPGRLELSLDQAVEARSFELRFERGKGSQRIASVEAYPTHIDDYTPLQAFKELTGPPVQRSEARLNPGPFLRQVARVTRKIESIKLKWREKRFAQCHG